MALKIIGQVEPFFTHTALSFRRTLVDVRGNYCPNHTISPTLLANAYQFSNTNDGVISNCNNASYSFIFGFHKTENNLVLTKNIKTGASTCSIGVSPCSTEVAPDSTEMLRGSTDIASAQRGTAQASSCEVHALTVVVPASTGMIPVSREEAAVSTLMISASKGGTQVSNLAPTFSTFQISASTEMASASTEMISASTEMISVLIKSTPLPSQITNIKPYGVTYFKNSFSNKYNFIH